MKLFKATNIYTNEVIHVMAAKPQMIEKQHRKTFYKEQGNKLMILSECLYKKEVLTKKSTTDKYEYFDISGKLYISAKKNMNLYEKVKALEQQLTLF